MKFNYYAIALLVALMSSACTGKDEAKKETKEELPLVKVATVLEEEVPQTSEYTATVEAFKTNNIASSTGNRIKRILVDVGSAVRAGQSLVILDDVNIAQQEIAMANQRRDLERAKELVRIGGGTQQAVDQLQAQYDANARALPWRGERDPYRIWLSEIMLQQTQTQTVKGYYARFLERFPDVFALAAADEEAVLKLWEGLGYYSRARNLHAAAKTVARELGGAFPEDAAGLRRLPGIPSSGQFSIKTKKR